MEVCPKSNLLRSRCKCYDCFPFWHPYRRHLSRGARRTRKKRLARLLKLQEEQNRWIAVLTAEHRAKHPEMYGDTDAG